ncbi:MAG: exonuclease SbcCD subunit D [Anaerolineales bacterium]|nr:MAG: exonuclease SbcCD subunit D [Anaerolineales bacterium]
MTEPIRMLHFADSHIGMENYGKIDPNTGTSSRVRDFLDRLDEVVDYAIEHRADLAVFAGDAFKDRSPDPTQQREFAQRIKRLADEVPTLLLVGNHDMPGMMVKANSLDIFRALDVPGVIVGYKDDTQVVQTAHGPVLLAWMPYPMRNRLMAWKKYQGKSIEELNQGLRAEVAKRIAVLTEEAAVQDMPRVFVGHFTVEAAKFGSERSVMLGGDLPILKSMVADPVWDYVALGHIHKHQDLNPQGYPPVVYSGSLERIDFGEEGEEKGFCWVELQRSETTWSFVPVNARPFRTVSIDVRSEEDPTAVVVDALERAETDGAVIRLQVQLRADQIPSLREREIEGALEDTASFIVAREIEDEARARLGELSPETLAPLELIERYFESRDVDPERLKALLAKAGELLE